MQRRKGVGQPARSGRKARRAAQNRQSDQTELRHLRPAEPRSSVPGDNMTDFMTDDTRHLGFVLGKRQETARHIYISAWQRHRVDDRTVEDREL